MTQLLGLPCLLFCWGKKKSSRDISTDTALSCIGLFWKGSFLRLANARDRQECWDKCLFDLFPPFTLGFSLLYVHKTPRQLISALWPLLIGLCERKAALAGEITHTCYFELSCHILSPCLQELQAPFCEPGLLCFHHHPQDQQEGPQVFCAVALPPTPQSTGRQQKGILLFLLQCEKVKVILGEGNTTWRHWWPFFHLCPAAPHCPYLPCCFLPHPPHHNRVSRCPASISPSQETSSLHGQVSQARKVIGVKMWNIGGKRAWICQAWWWIMQFLEDEEDTYC